MMWNQRNVNVVAWAFSLVWALDCAGEAGPAAATISYFSNFCLRSDWLFPLLSSHTRDSFKSLFSELWLLFQMAANGLAQGHSRFLGDCLPFSRLPLSCLPRSLFSVTVSLGPHLTLYLKREDLHPLIVFTLLLFSLPNHLTLSNIPFNLHFYYVC